MTEEQRACVAEFGRAMGTTLEAVEELVEAFKFKSAGVGIDELSERIEALGLAKNAFVTGQKCRGVIPPGYYKKNR
ncbi:hypothetical protein [Myroides odoratimimus]|uniref:hypothetical protein n=1 Tax=Myroides odoratimimus TaxID=76832 RepID=UPI00257622BD|nr:hypothetical protein [Myroides odoratimimus]MDM1325899.1 hypothetical protein [Myroides odoratimimus]MDM1452196.1 hypothetical protein [Myroides odoratimimus]MDM1475465.1 hypothetical protein [Myroides odoratimimus]MDM1488248.1 hypothetical protein [Myroides odoratimimus]